LASFLGCTLLVDTSGLSDGANGPNDAGDAGGDDGGRDAAPDGSAPLTTPWLAYGSASGAVFVRTFDASTGTFSPPLPGPTGGFGVVRWVVAKQSPAGPVLGIVDVTPTGTGRLSVFESAGASWTLAFTSSVADTSKRSFDVEVDASGNVMVVYGDGTPAAKYRRRTAGAWSPEQTIATGGTLPILWVELAADPRSQAIGLAYVDAGSNLDGALWTSGGWTAPIQLEGNIPSRDFKCFDLAYERVSGGLLTVWGHLASTADGGNDYFMKWTRTPPGASAFADSPTPELAGKPAGPIRLAPQSGSDQIALAYLEYNCNRASAGCDDFVAGVWTGTAWSALGTLDPNTTTLYGGRSGTMPVGVAWVGGTSTAVAVYHRDLPNEPGLLPFTTFAGGSWSSVDGGMTGPALPARASLAAVSTPLAVLVLIEDTAGQLWGRRFSAQGTWTDTDQGTALATALVSTGGVPFDVAP
jgi:hypothetical protein